MVHAKNYNLSGYGMSTKTMFFNGVGSNYERRKRAYFNETYSRR